MQFAPLMDKRVVIHGTSREDMNGKCGVATDFHLMDRNDPAADRYTVRLDGSGEEFKLRPDRLRAGGSAGARTKKKGGKGGKKNRKRS